MKRTIILLILGLTIFFCGYKIGVIRTTEHSGNDTTTATEAGTTPDATTAQTSDDTTHLSFKGVPINGGIRQFVKRLQATGLKPEMYRDNYGEAELEGEFAGYRDCDIFAYANKASNNVYEVAVIFDDHKEWKDIFDNYQDLKKKLTAKYGKPSECKEKVEGYGRPDSNIDWMMRLSEGQITYTSTFKAAKGTIMLEIIKDDYEEGHVVLRYTDKQNGNDKNAADQSDI